MSHDEMQSTMNFILEQQAQYAVRLQKDEERLARLEKAFVTLTELARNADERMDTFDEHLSTQIERLNTYLQAQSEDFYARLAAEKQALDARLAADKDEFNARLVADKDEFNARLAAQREEFEWRLQASSMKGLETDQRLDRLSVLVERHLERRDGE